MTWLGIAPLGQRLNESAFELPISLVCDFLLNRFAMASIALGNSKPSVNSIRLRPILPIRLST